MKKQQIITEEINRSRKLMGLPPLTSKSNIVEQASFSNTYHEWEDCSNAYISSGIRYYDQFSMSAAITEYGSAVAGPNGSNPVSSMGWFMGAPAPYDGATQNLSNANLLPANLTHATHQNSLAFYQGMGSPSPGTTLKYTSGPGNIGGATDYCLRYVGTVSTPSTGNHKMDMGSLAITNINGPYTDCQMCQMGVLAPTFDCVNGTCTVILSPAVGQYTDLAACQADCVDPLSVEEKYRCYDCNTPCSQMLIDNGLCPYDTTSDCETECEKTDKWSCGMPDKFGKPRCRQCTVADISSGITCWDTKEECLEDGDCKGKMKGGYLDTKSLSPVNVMKKEKPGSPEIKMDRDSR